MYNIALMGWCIRKINKITFLISARDDQDKTSTKFQKFGGLQGFFKSIVQQK